MFRRRRELDRLRGELEEERRKRRELEEELGKLAGERELLRRRVEKLEDMLYEYHLSTEKFEERGLLINEIIRFRREMIRRLDYKPPRAETIGITHRDPDGIGAAAICKRANPSEQIEFVYTPAHASMNWLRLVKRPRKLYVLDLILSEEGKRHLRRLLRGGTEVICIDHHETSSDVVASELVFSTDKSASMLAYDLWYERRGLEDKRAKEIALMGGVADGILRSGDFQTKGDYLELKRAFRTLRGALLLYPTDFEFCDRVTRGMAKRGLEALEDKEVVDRARLGDMLRIHTQQLIERRIRVETEHYILSVLYPQDKVIWGVPPLIEIGLRRKKDVFCVYPQERRARVVAWAYSGADLGGFLSKVCPRLGGRVLDRIGLRSAEGSINKECISFFVDEVRNFYELLRS
jgi:hypothetical protein